VIALKGKFAKPIYKTDGAPTTFVSKCTRINSLAINIPLVNALQNGPSRSPDLSSMVSSS
jgi:hypothetical protein